MIRILCCFKTVPDPDRFSEADWASGAESGNFDFGWIQRILDPSSEIALELALRARDSSKGSKVLEAGGSGASSPAPEIRLTAAALEGETADRELRALAALGFDETWRIELPGTSEPDAETTAAAIADFCRKTGPYDLIVTGSVSADGENRKIPFLLAESLGIPCLNQVLSFQAISENRIAAEYGTESGRIRESAALPLVLACGDSPGVLLRIPTLMQRRASSGHEIRVFSVDSETVGAPRVVLEGLEQPDAGRSAERIGGSSAEEQAENLFVFLQERGLV